MSIISGCLEVEDGTILKHVQCPPKGQRELDFYENVFNKDSTDEVLLELRLLVPKYHGLVESETNGTVVKRKIFFIHNVSKRTVFLANA